MKPVRIGLVGCGHIVRFVHLQVLTRLSGVRLVALAEPDPERRRAAARRAPGAIAVATHEELLNIPEVEAVVICVPNALHAGVAIAALERRKHVYLEKPLAMNLDEGRAVLAAWRRAGVVGMIGFNYRFNKLYMAARHQLQAGRLGKLVMVRSVFSTATTPPGWKQFRESGGGVLLDLASHHVDLIRFLLQREVGEVFAEVQSQRSEDDSAALQLRLTDGLLVQSFFSMSAVEEDRFEVYGQAAKLTVDRHLSLDVRVTEPTLHSIRLKQIWRGLRILRHGPYLIQKLRAPGFEPSYLAAVARFAAAVRAGEHATPDLDDGYRSLATLEAAEESARFRRVVSLVTPLHAGLAP
jgi:myo-inositol 2-dehydrogenase / D-chiro-inositol 1-dehydrogenase